MKNLRENRWKKGTCTLVLTILLGAAGVSTALAEGEDTFVQGTSVNGLGISNMTVEEAAGRIGSFYSVNMN